MQPPLQRTSVTTRRQVTSIQVAARTTGNAPIRGGQVRLRSSLDGRQIRQKEAAQKIAEPVQVRRPSEPSPLPKAWDYLELCDNSHLGGGAFAEVYKVTDKRSGEMFAVKMMHRPNFTLRGIDRQVEMEIDAMQRAANQKRDTQAENHVVTLMNAHEEGEYVYLLLELCEQGDALKLLQDHEPTLFSEPVAADLARQILLGLETIHSLGFIHRDIKPDNLLITSKGILKIGDFGWCCLADEEPTSLAGTFIYMAPEVLGNIPQTRQADMWSFAVTLFQMLLGQSPLRTYLGPGATQVSETDQNLATSMRQGWLLEEINTTCPPLLASKPNALSDACWDFMRSVLVPNPFQRLSVQAALAHPWITRVEVPRAIVMANEVVAQTNAFVVDISAPEVEVAVPAVAQALQEQKLDEPSSPPPTPPQPAKDLLLSSVGFKEVVNRLPTPQKPRIWDPARNMAYSPPVSPEMTPERPSPAKIGFDKENETLDATPVFALPVKVMEESTEAKEAEPDRPRKPFAPLDRVATAGPTAGPADARRSLGAAPRISNGQLKPQQHSNLTGTAVSPHLASSVRLQSRCIRSPVLATRDGHSDLLSATSTNVARDILLATASSKVAGRVAAAPKVMPPRFVQVADDAVALLRREATADLHKVLIVPSTSPRMPWRSGRASPITMHRAVSPAAFRATCTVYSMVAAQFANNVVAQPPTWTSQGYASVPQKNGGLVSAAPEPMGPRTTSLPAHQVYLRQMGDSRATIVSKMPNGSTRTAASGPYPVPLGTGSVTMPPILRSRRLSAPGPGSGWQHVASTAVHR